MEVVIALKRERREDAPEDWPRMVAETPGVSVAGEPMFGRLMAEVSDEAMAELTEKMGELLLIEPVIRHFPSDEPEPGP